LGLVWDGTSGGPALLATLVGSVAGALAGRNFRYYECSACDARLKHEQSTCSRCGGRVRGTIASKVDRLDAAEAFAKGAFKSLD
jgi:hypothetical protein